MSKEMTAFEWLQIYKGDYELCWRLEATFLIET